MTSIDKETKGCVKRKPKEIENMECEKTGISKKGETWQEIA